MRQMYKMIYLYLVEKILFVSEVNALAPQHYSISERKQLALAFNVCRNNKHVPQDLSIEKDHRIFTRRWTLDAHNSPDGEGESERRHHRHPLCFLSPETADCFFTILVHRKLVTYTRREMSIAIHTMRGRISSSRLRVSRIYLNAMMALDFQGEPSIKADVNA